MTRTALAATLVALCATQARAALPPPSFMQQGDVFCTSESDFDDFVRNGHPRPNSAVQTCQFITRPTRVAVMRGQGGVKSMVEVLSGSLSYEVGWTNGKLPLAK